MIHNTHFKEIIYKSSRTIAFILLNLFGKKLIVDLSLEHFCKYKETKFYIILSL